MKANLMPSLNEEVYAVLRENLLSIDQSYSSEEVVLCPICLRKVNRAQVLAGGIEHIIPQVVANNDPADEKARATRNQRCGITLLCRQSRRCKSDDYLSKNGCNGLKGRLYDRLFKKLFDDQPRSANELTHRHGVAILIMGYLAAFQSFGYEFILRSEMDGIREQFDYPNERRTNYLDEARYSRSASALPQLLTETGQPFLWSSMLQPDASLRVMFRRCSVALPGGHWQLKTGVRHLSNLIPMAT
jgi:hypothetical protein